MQGTGTQTDPYYPTNWSEFVTAIGQRGVYIECPENGVWDMDEMLPDGIRSNVIWRDNTVYGNGLTINNLYFNGGELYFLDSSATNIYKLNFLNMTTSGSSEYMFYNSSASKNVFFRNCKFSGLISSGNIFYVSNSSSSSIYLTHDGEKSCSLNFHFTGNGILNKYSGVYFRYCAINLSGVSTATFSSYYVAYEKCYISGISPWRYLHIYGYDNVIDIEIPTGKYLANNNDYGKWKTNVLNIDKLHGGYEYTNSSHKCLQATTEELSDAAYLQSIGFSIAAG